LVLVLSSTPVFSNSLCGVSIGDGLSLIDTLNDRYVNIFNSYEDDFAYRNVAVEQEWELDNGSILNVLWYLGEEVYATGRVVYIEHRMTEIGQSSGYPNFIFGETCLLDILDHFGNSGFTYPRFLAYQTSSGGATMNMWFITDEKPRGIAAFMTEQSYEDGIYMQNNLYIEDVEEVEMFILEHHLLMKIILIDEVTADIFWETPKLYFDSTYTGEPINWN